MKITTRKTKLALSGVILLLVCIFPLMVGAKVYSPTPDPKSTDTNNVGQQGNNLKPGFKAPILTPEQLKEREDQIVAQSGSNQRSSKIPLWLVLLSSASAAALGTAWMIAKNKAASLTEKIYSTSVGQFILGTGNAFVSNFAFGIGRQQAETKSFRLGQVLGDGLSMLASAIEIALAFTTDVLVGGGGLVLSPVTGGGSLVVSAGAVLTGAVVASHASGQAVSAVYQMSKTFSDLKNLRPKVNVSPEDIPTERISHILEGEKDPLTGKWSGGHRNGSSIGKDFGQNHTEFPKDWSDDKILKSVTEVINDEDAFKSMQGNRAIFEKVIDGVKIRSVYDTVTKIVISGYPIN